MGFAHRMIRCALSKRQRHQRTTTSLEHLWECSIFMPAELKPLYKLLGENVRWEWQDRVAFKRPKDWLMRPRVLTLQSRSGTGCGSWCDIIHSVRIEDTKPGRARLCAPGKRGACSYFPSKNISQIFCSAESFLFIQTTNRNFLQWKQCNLTGTSQKFVSPRIISSRFLNHKAVLVT